MAKKPESYGSPLEKESCDRLEACRRQKAEFDLDIREAYFFSQPHRAREIRSEQPASTARPDDAGEMQTGMGAELARDFVTEVVNAFMPESEPWAEQGPGVILPADKVQTVKTAAKDQDRIVFDAIKSSNLYTVLPMAFAPDLAVGTCALWIDDPYPGQNFVVQAVPLRELEINIGPHGGIDDRFIVRHTKNRYVEALLPGVTLPGDVMKKIQEKPDDLTEIRWGYWRKWERRDDIVWQHVVMIGKKLVKEAVLVGAGSCPLVVTRFNPMPEWAYGSGPLIEALPDLRQLDALEGDVIDHIEIALRPPTAYPDDSFTAVENGIEPGSAYPVRPGSENAIKPIFEGGDVDGALFSTEKLEARLRRRFYLDFPEQRGKTPPTLGQWLDEMARAQRRIGTPGASFWREGPAEIFLRFKYLLTARGVLAPLEVDGKTVALVPFNPAQRAAEQQEVNQSVQFLNIVLGLFPEEGRLAIDGKATIDALRTKMRANLAMMRSEDDIETALAQISQLIEGRQRISPADTSGLPLQ